MSSVITNSSYAISNATAWASATAKSCGNAVLAGVSKVGQIATSIFQALAEYATSAYEYAKDGVVAGWNLAKANPKIALGGLALAVAVGAAVYANRRQHAAAV